MHKQFTFMYPGSDCHGIQETVKYNDDTSSVTTFVNKFMTKEIVPSLKSENIEATLAKDKAQKEFFEHVNTTITKINA